MSSACHKILTNFVATDANLSDKLRFGQRIRIWGVNKKLQNLGRKCVSHLVHLQNGPTRFYVPCSELCPHVPGVVSILHQKKLLPRHRGLFKVDRCTKIEVQFLKKISHGWNYIISGVEWSWFHKSRVQRAKIMKVCIGGGKRIEGRFGANATFFKKCHISALRWAISKQFLSTTNWLPYEVVVQSK